MKKASTYSFAKYASGLFMILALLWLAVSTPFVNAAQQVQREHLPSCAGDDNPFSNTTEEKSESGTSLLSEYLHEAMPVEHPSILISKIYKCHSQAVYFAYHPELISPPPEA